jgi:predicted AlkP superfamily pyrophosphatase or phosphodiesterase
VKRAFAVFAVVFLCVASLALSGQSGSGGVNRAEHIGKPYVILVSVDGFKPEYLERFTLPNLQRVIKRGARAHWMKPVFPTLTFPNHYSLVTGLRPARHGIVFNSFWDPVRGEKYALGDEKSVSDGTWYGGEPIWVTAETQGMVAACFFWPGSEAAIKGVRPSLYRSYLHTLPNSERVASLLEWLRLPVASRPHILTLYFSTLDSASHAGRLDRPAIQTAALEVDAAIGQLLDGIDALPIAHEINLLITSDHGMVDTRRAQVIDIEKIADMSGVVAFFGGPVTAVHVPDAAKAVRIRDQVNAALRHGRAYLRQAVPERFYLRDTPRAGDVVIIMDEGWTMERGRGRDRIDEWGQHGWDNTLPSMRATFIAMGPTIRAGLRVGEVENIDVYPFMAELLGLRPAEGIDGKAGRIRTLIAR